MRVPQWVANLFADKAPAPEQPPPVKINPATNLPSVSSTVERSAWQAKQSRQSQWISEQYVASGPPADRSSAAAHGHPAGSAMREDPWGHRQAARSRGAEYRSRFQPPTLWQPPVRDMRQESRDHRDDPAPPGWGGGGPQDSGRVENPNPPPGYRS